MHDSDQRSDGASTPEMANVGSDRDAGQRTSRRTFLRAGAAAGAGLAALGVTGTASAHAVEKCELWDQIPVGGGDFALFDNQWSDKNADQCIWKDNDGHYGYTFTDAGGGGFNYPEVFIGHRPWGEDTGVQEFMIERGNVDQLEMTVDAELDISGGEWDWAEEWWLMDGQPASSDPPLTHEIMMVLDWNRNHSHGGVENANVWTDKFGNTVDHWAYYPNGGGTNGAFHIFRVQGGMTSGSVDLKPIIDYLSNNYGIRDDLMISGIELGNEYQNGTSGTVTYNQFDVTINGTTYTSGPEGGSNRNEETTTTTPEPTTTTTQQAQAPNAPGSVWRTGITDTSVELGWTSVSGADGYRVYVDGRQRAETGSTSATVTGLSPDTSYQIGLAAYNDAGESSRATTTVTTNESSQSEGTPGSISGSGSLPNDPDDDGLYEDVNGNGRQDIADAVDLFQNQDSVDPQYFDFNDSGEMEIGDAVELFRENTGGA